MIKLRLLFLLLIFIVSCKTETLQKQPTNHSIVVSKDINVITSVIQTKTFSKQLISNGVIEIKAKVDLRFKTAERIAKIYVKNGQKVTKGAILAKLDNRLLANQDQIFTGTITEINPLIDENGLICIKAAINQNNTTLLTGMHVKVIINKPIKNVVVIPKKALILRSNNTQLF